MSKHAVMPLSDYADICDNIRGHLKINDKLTSDDIPPKIDEVFRQGAFEAYAPAYDKGYADKSAEYNQIARDFSIVVYGEEKNEAIENVVNTAITDIGDTKVAIQTRGVEVPNNMPTSDLPQKIYEVYDYGADIGFSAGKEQGRNEYAEELLPYNHNLQQAVFGIPTVRDIEVVTEQAASDLNAIKGKIEEKGVDIPSLTPSSEYPAKIEDVYDKGYEQGKSEGDYEGAFNEGKAEAYEEIQDLNAELEQTLYGTDTGGKSYYDEFWDDYLDYGNRKDFDHAFGGIGWTPENFNPNRDMTPTNAYMMFRKCKMRIDLVEHLNKLGVNLDFSKCTNTIYAFNFSEFTRIGVFDCSSSASSIPLSNVFTSCSYLVTIDKIVLKKGSGGMFETTSFKDCTSLENVTFEGVIDVNGLNLQWSTKLSKDSITSIINILSTTTSGLSITLSKVAVNTAFETSAGLADGSTSSDWNNLIGTKTNWTINLV